MDGKKIKRYIDGILSFLVDVDGDEILPEHNLCSDYGFDEFDRIELFDMLEEHFKINIPSDVCDMPNTVQDIYTMIEELLKNKRNGERATYAEENNT